MADQHNKVQTGTLEESIRTIFEAMFGELDDPFGRAVRADDKPELRKSA